VIKDLEIGDYPRLSGLSENVFIRGRQGRSERRRQCADRSNALHCWTERERKGHEPRNAGDL